MIIPQERYNPKDIILGYAQKRVLDIVAKASLTQKPKPGQITSRDVVRDHTFADSVFRGFLDFTFDPDTGDRVVKLTALGERARTHGKVARKPATGKSRAPRGSLLAAQRDKAKTRKVVKMRPAAKRRKAA